MRFWLALLLMAGLAACASPARDLPAPPPPPPTAFEPGVDVSALWTARVGRTPPTDSYRLPPAVAEGRVYVADAGGRLHAFDADSGQRLWQVELDFTPGGGPGVGAAAIVVAGREGEVAGLAPTDGRLLWRSAVSSEVMAVPAVADSMVVVRSGDGRVTGLSADSGRRVWTYDHTPPVLTLRGTSSPQIAGRSLAVVGLDNGRLLALDLRDGNVLWEAEVAAPRGRTELERMVDIDGDPVVFGREVYAASYQGRLVAAALANGRIAWSRDFSSHVGQAVDSERVYAVDVDNKLWAFDRFSGASIWRQEALRAVQLTAPAVYGDYLLVGDSEGYLNWLSLQDGELLDRTRVGGAIHQPPLVHDGRVHVLTSRGELAVYRLP